ncbi:MAG: excinuclease ABC subunit UvrB [Proteobacteria bacterium]|nr:excinuclease ABC subunit UvrB [Pseudomonadota bacterium]
MPDFKLVSEYTPAGDQPEAIRQLVEGLNSDMHSMCLLGATGTGKTFTMAHVVQELNRPTLVVAHNKILAAQLYGEFKELFPDNAVEYFVSYYNYYQPEAYVPSSDTYIEKDSLINDRIDRLRHRATRSLLERRDVLIVASVSCIYGIGSRRDYGGMAFEMKKGDLVGRDPLMRRLVEMAFIRKSADFHRGTFRAKGDTVEIYPAHEDDVAIRVEFWGDEIERITLVDPLRGKVLEEVPSVPIYPASHYVTEEDRLKGAVETISIELEERLRELRDGNRLLEAQRLEQRTMFDLEQIQEMGRCPGIENYSRHLSGRQVDEPPPTLVEYFPRDFLLIVDESHAMVPQIGAMFSGDRSRKTTLVDYGFRLPSAKDNRPLRFEEFWNLVNQTVFVSATPADWEIDRCQGVLVEQVIRPTGLVDPQLEVRPAGTQVDDFLGEIRATVEKGDRVLVTVLTKRMAEDLTEYYQEVGVRARYLHSEIDTLERIELLKDLRTGEYDVLVGINLLREGLDLPEVSLVGVFDADKEGFLRSGRSLLQVIGRAARNVDGRVLLYADKETDSMKAAISETNRRRARQEAYNVEHGITPETVKKGIRDILASIYEKDYVELAEAERDLPAGMDKLAPKELGKEIEKLRTKMFELARDLEFEKAADMRDQIAKAEAYLMSHGGN